LISRHQSVQNAESLSNFSCIPSADLDNKTMSSAYIKQWIDNLECVSRYKYLGIWFNNSGSFNFAQNELYQKALKVLFKLKSDFLVHNPEVKTSIHVFDHKIL
jgi:hypothetical protein